MATTSPDNIWTPDAGDDYALTTDLAATADTVQDALNTVRGERRPLFGRFAATQAQAPGGGTVTSGTMGALSGISLTQSITSPANTRAKISLHFKFSANAVGCGAIIGVAASGATTITPISADVTNVQVLQQAVNQTNTYSGSWLVNLNAGTTNFSVVGQAIGVGGTRSIATINLVIEPVAE